MFAFTDSDRARKMAATRPAPAPKCDCRPKVNQTWHSLAVRSRFVDDTRTEQSPGSCCEGKTKSVESQRLDSSAAAARREDVGNGTPQTTMGGDPFHREHQCSNQPDPDKPQRKSLTQREYNRAMFGLIAARSIASKAFMNLGNRDPYHLKKAERAFHKSVSFETLDKHVTMIRSVLDRLTLDKNLVGATCDEKQCNDGFHNAVAVTLDDLSAVLLCPFFFVQPGRTLATTLIHEAGHMANIDVHFEPGKEQYCRPDDTIDCGNICPLTGEDLLENVDAWMRFIYCIAMSS